jgi:hypothetical protein
LIGEAIDEIGRGNRDADCVELPFGMLERPLLAFAGRRTPM